MAYVKAPGRCDDSKIIYRYIFVTVQQSLANRQKTLDFAYISCNGGSAISYPKIGSRCADGFEFTGDCIAEHL